MRRLLAALTLTFALVLVAPIAAHAIAGCMPGTGPGFEMPCMPFFEPPPEQTTGTITVTKVIVGEGEERGPLTTGDFPLFVDETPVTSGMPMPGFTFGTHHVSETQQPNYTLVGYSGDCDQQGNVTVTTQYGFATCVITNQYVQPEPPANGTVTIHKTVINSASGTATVENFYFTIDEETSVTLGEPISLSPGVHTVTEHSRTKETYYASYSASCPEGVFTVVSEQNVDCYITNSDMPPVEPPVTPTSSQNRPKPPATIVIVTSVTNDEGGVAGSSDFISTVTTGGTPMSIAGAGASGASLTVAPGSYAITASTQPGYAWSMSGQCSGVLTEGGTATCTIDYDDTGDTPPTPPPTEESPAPPEGLTPSAETPPEGEEPPTEEPAPAPPAVVEPPPAPPTPRTTPSGPAPQVLGTTDFSTVGDLPIAATTTAPLYTPPEPEPTPAPAPGCTWFWGWFACYWWLLLLLIVIGLIWHAWKKMNEKKQP